MGWFGNSSKDDNDDSQEGIIQVLNKFLFKFFDNVSTTNCNVDPNDNKFKICQIREKKTEHIDGKKVTTIHEREERVPNGDELKVPTNKNVEDHILDKNPLKEAKSPNKILFPESPQQTNAPQNTISHVPEKPKDSEASQYNFKFRKTPYSKNDVFDI